ncbi:MAG: hypothetical protein A3K76_01510 [Euryarchaeota archaeon RBG_13_57_23]|nr:MAG: hypothetical protein A3K76_01510 [Euryarchaeota archaeon RBG_13_57_23]
MSVAAYGIYSDVSMVASLRNWPSYVAERTGMASGKDLTYRLRNGAVIKVRAGTSDTELLREVLVSKCYNPPGFEIGRDDTVVDIGAHIGSFSILASKLADKGIIHSFEPMPDNFARLRENVALNNAKNIKLHESAVSHSIDVRTLSISPSHTGSHSFYPQIWSEEKPVQEVTVNTTTMKAFVDSEGIDHIDFLKMDCEGAEYEILYSCPDEVLNRIRRISMEHHQVDGKDANPHALKKYLENKGFSVDAKFYETDNYPMIYARR